MADENKILKDISILTNIPTYIIENIFNVFEKEIQKEIYDSVVLSKKDRLDINIGIGKLNIDVDINNGVLTYDFIPSKSLEKGIVKSLREEKNPIIEDVERNFKNKVLSVYKELI